MICAPLRMLESRARVLRSIVMVRCPCALTPYVFSRRQKAITVDAARLIAAACPPIPSSPRDFALMSFVPSSRQSGRPTRGESESSLEDIDEFGPLAGDTMEVDAEFMIASLTSMKGRAVRATGRSRDLNAIKRQRSRRRRVANPYL